MAGRVSLGKPDPHTRNALEYRWESVLVALANGNDALVEIVALVGIRCYSSDEKRPDRVNCGIEGTLDRKGEEDGMESIGKLEDGGMEARESKHLLARYHCLPRSSTYP